MPERPDDVIEVSLPFLRGEAKNAGIDLASRKSREGRRRAQQGDARASAGPSRRDHQSHARHERSSYLALKANNDVEAERHLKEADRSQGRGAIRDPKLSAIEMNGELGRGRGQRRRGRQ
ncbi:hypothetical protein [Mesorhizobium sp.]|uniref:hypothetical protein n=1 Tax=Mesorhizobium sp. TaxID=1871066 RepID=UPI000FE325B0|nr:hypothetical protein [Mesorhizobium sp.]RWB94186.1 MAG: hypothetical protein EOQ56_31930 [Mesorhizobium sp.]RWO59031.1 MAG: hypothetical protein EOS14_16365 [Mesorhizobium sp.]RWQ12654.1 MAG: hypothetical protein EOR92_33145 [Mesorhizobium sp.]